MDLLAAYDDDGEPGEVPTIISCARDAAPSVNTAGLALVNSLDGRQLVVPLASTKNLQGEPPLERVGAGAPWAKYP